MQIMKRYSFLLTILCVVFAFASCDDGNVTTLYDDGGNAKVAFASNVMVKSMKAEDGNKILVPVYRSNKIGTSPIVQLIFTTGTAATGKFSLPVTSVTFEDDSAVAYAEIVYSDIESLSATASYTMTLAIEDSTILSPSMENIISISASRQLTYESLGTGLFTSTFFEQSWEQPVLKAKEGEVYKLEDCYATGYPIIFSVADDNSVKFEAQKTGYVDADYGMISINQNTTYASNKIGKTVTLIGKFTVSAGSFGTFAETVELP